MSRVTLCFGTLLLRCYFLLVPFGAPKLGQSGNPVVSLTAPRTSPDVMIDGVLSKGEWKNASTLALQLIARLYFQTSAEFIYIAVEFARSPSGMVDLFISPAEGRFYDLHASAKLGERQLDKSSYPEWVWWTNRDWVATKTQECARPSCRCLSYPSTIEEASFLVPGYCRLLFVATF